MRLSLLIGLQPMLIQQLPLCRIKFDVKSAVVIESLIGVAVSPHLVLPWCGTYPQSPSTSSSYRSRELSPDSHLLCPHTSSTDAVYRSTLTIRGKVTSNSRWIAQSICRSASINTGHLLPKSSNQPAAISRTNATTYPTIDATTDFQPS